ncbi:MAG TPA: aspartate-semialdehyde dehydrogenase [Candidatus Eisenbacteria bacterium]|nr:aspartate-semialdehyde dehydrogenase [Candidatus Eisenbacteria bacterium]
MKQLRTAVVGATGITGQQALVALANHPWFTVTTVAASARTAGKPYAEAIRDANGARLWWCREDPPAAVMNLTVVDAAKLDPGSVDVVFSLIESDAARELEPKFAKVVPTFSSASAYRYETDVPILVPGVNMVAHFPLVEHQRRQRGWKGFVLPQSNCTTVGIVVSLKPILDRFGVRRALVTTMQGISGAGRAGGVLGLDMVDNLIPFIPKEEEKVARETGKILGRLGEGTIEPASLVVGATCTRAAVLDGHTAAIAVETEKPCSPDDVAAAMRAFGGDYAGMNLPSAPAHPIIVHDDPFRPQPRLDRDADGGMATSVGRIRPEPALPNGIKYLSLSHNTKMGAAKGLVLTAEYLHKAGYLTA